MSTTPKEGDALSGAGVSSRSGNPNPRGTSGSSDSNWLAVDQWFGGLREGTPGSTTYATRDDAVAHLRGKGHYSEVDIQQIVDVAYRINNIPYGNPLKEGDLEGAANFIASDLGWASGKTQTSTSTSGSSTSSSGEANGETSMSSIIEDYMRLAEQQYQKNLANVGQDLGKIGEAGLALTRQADEYNRLANIQDWESSYGTPYDTLVDELVGRRRGLLEELTGSVSDLARGMVPKDVQDALLRANAEKYQAQGLFGQAADYSDLRHLGLTSLQATQMAAEMTTSTISPLSQSLLNTAQLLQQDRFSPAAGISAAGSMVGKPMSMDQTAQLAQQQAQWDKKFAYQQELNNIAMAERQRNWDYYQSAANAQAKQDQLNANIGAMTDILPFLTDWGNKAWDWVSGLGSGGFQRTFGNQSSATTTDYTWGAGYSASLPAQPWYETTGYSYMPDYVNPDNWSTSPSASSYDWDAPTYSTINDAPWIQ